MAYKGYDMFFAEANSGEDYACKVCGSLCNVARNVHGPTSWASALAQKYTYHDLFVCPHSDEPWHEHAVELAIAIDATPSKQVAALMRADLEELIRENLPQG